MTKSKNANNINLYTQIIITEMFQFSTFGSRNEFKQ